MPALKSCIAIYPQMAMIMKAKDTKGPFWKLVPSLNHDDHISVIDEQVMDEDGENTAIERILLSIVDQRSKHSSIPPWRIVVLPFALTSKPRCFIAYVSSHSIADGASGYVWHRKFLEAVQEPVDNQVTMPLLRYLTSRFPKPWHSGEIPYFSRVHEGFGNHESHWWEHLGWYPCLPWPWRFANRSENHRNWSFSTERSSERLLSSQYQAHGLVRQTCSEGSEPSSTRRWIQKLRFPDRCRHEYGQ